MRRGWGRWRGYADELEEALRVAGEHLAETEALSAEAWEKETWARRQAQSISREMVRRALDIPVLGDLLRTAFTIDSQEALTPPDFIGEPWPGEGHQASLSSVDRAAGRPRVEPVIPQPGEQPPARIRAAERALLARSRSLVVVLDDLVGARNASAVVRTAEALGLQEVHLIQQEGRVSLERTVTMLAERWLDLFWYQRAEEAISAFRSSGHRIWVADYAPGSLPLSDLPVSDRMALVFGSEQRGVSPAMRAAADGFFHLPTAGLTSYVNVSVMAGIALHHVDAQMRQAGERRPLESEDREALRRAWYGALARGDQARAARYLGWADRGVEPAPPKGASATRRNGSVKD